MTDRKEIIRALQLWFEPGDVFEIRALDAVTGQNLRCHTESGYFDYEHIAQAADAIGKIRSAAGIYVTINPVKHDLLARAVYKIRDVKRSPLTADTNIERRHWLLIDCDPVRESGIASNDAEHEAAIAKAKEIRDGLASMGWPSPILTDSGNGAHLTYRIDLPSDDDGLVQRVLEAISVVATEGVDIDLSVFNPARIVRLPGTMNCKGDDIDGKVCGRPHRMAKIIEAPERIIAVTEDQLRSVAGRAKAPAVQVMPEFRECDVEDGFDLDEWIAKYAPDAGPPREYNEGRLWQFRVCPFNPEHNNSATAIFQFPSGKPGFGCRHNGCHGNDWKKFRALRQPGCYDHLPKEDPGVDFSGLLKPKPAEKQESAPEEQMEDVPPWRKITSDDIRKALDGTVLGEMCDLLSNVSIPPLPIEAVLPKALVLCGAALSQRITSEDQRVGDGNLKGISGFGKKLARLRIHTGDGQICNFYTLLAAPSGSGKDIGGLVDTMANHFGWFIGNSGSAEGLADAFINLPNGVLAISELQPFLDPNCWQHRATEFLTPAFNKGFFKQNFSGRGKYSSTREAQYCAPNVVAFVQPDVFEATAGIIDLHSGFLGRFLFTVVPDFHCEANIYDNDKVIERFAECLENFRRKKGLVEVPLGYAHDLILIFKKYAARELSTCWQRLANEYYPRIAVVLSVRHNADPADEKVTITDDNWKRAQQITLWFYGQAEKLLLRINDALPLIKAREKLLQKIFMKIRCLDKGNGVTLREISRGGIRNSNGKERREAVAELAERGFITCREGRYSIVNTPPEWAE